MKKSKDVQKAKYSFYGKVADSFSKIFTTIFKWGFAFLMIRELAGKITFADIKILVGFDSDNLIKIDPISSISLKAGIIVGLLGFLCGVFGIIYGYKQRKLKEEVISRTGNRIKKLESKIDPNRSSSNLTSKGNTQMVDV